MTIRIIAAFLFLALSSCGQQKAKDCEVLLKKTPYFIRHGLFETNDSLQLDFEILRKCGELDSIDSAILLNESWINVIMMNRMFSSSLFGINDSVFTTNQVATYDTILRYIDDYRGTEQYTEFRSRFVSPVQLVERQKRKDAFFEEHFNRIGIRTPPAPDKIEFINLGDIKTAIQIAKKNGKRALFYFSSHTSAEAQELEKGLLTYDPIKRVMSENYICFVAYTDEKELDPKTGLTFGKKYKKLQLEKFKSDLQPYFCIVDDNGKVLSEIFYTIYTEDFIEFLNKGRE